MTDDRFKFDTEPEVMDELDELGCNALNSRVFCTMIEQIMWKSLDKRVASFLLEETSIEGTNELKITHETIANHLGSHREVITRMLRYFQGDGLVKLSRGKITILDSKRLETLQRS